MLSVFEGTRRLTPSWWRCMVAQLMTLLSNDANYFSAVKQAWTTQNEVEALVLADQRITGEAGKAKVSLCATYFTT